MWFKGLVPALYLVCLTAHFLAAVVAPGHGTCRHHRPVPGGEGAWWGGVVKIDRILCGDLWGAGGISVGVPCSDILHFQFSGYSQGVDIVVDKCWVPVDKCTLGERKVNSR